MAELGEIWRPVNSAHAIQNAFCLVSWAERVPTRLLKTAIDAIRPTARKCGLASESPITSVTFQAQPGIVTAPTSEEVGTELYSRETGGGLVNRAQITTESVRFDTWRYTRWATFRSQIEDIVLPVTSQIETVVPIQSVAMEYTDFFYAVHPGIADPASLIEIASPDVCRSAAQGKTFWHSHAGWIEPRGSGSQRLVNVDVNSQEAQHPTLGKRHVITIRTLEREERAAGGDATQSLNMDNGLLDLLDDLHRSLKARLASVLSQEARDLISLGSN